MKKRKPFPDDPTDCETQREYNRQYYDKNRETELKRQEKFREENPNYYKRWYEENKEWRKLTAKLRQICRPDMVKKCKLQHYYPGLDASDVEFDEETQKKCEEVFQRMLRRLRKLKGRDPETGRKLNENSN